MVAALPIWADLSTGWLRALARLERSPRAASRMHATAYTPEGKSHTDSG